MKNKEHIANLEIFLSLIKSSGILNPQYIVEVGSMDGDDSLFFKSHFPSANVYAIEGLEENYEKLLKNKTTINTFNIIITDHIGDTDYYVKNINGLHGIYDRGDIYGNKILQKLPCITLDKFCEDNNIPQIDVLKIDVEGATYDVLSGALKILPNIGIMHIETETFEFFKNQKLHTEVEKFLKAHNFEMIYFTKSEIIPSKYQCDSIWLNRNLIKKDG